MNDLSSMGAPSTSDDSNVAFSQEAFTSLIPIGKDGSGQLQKREAIIEIYIAKDTNSDYQLLKQVNMNLAQFVDSGKVDDVISF